MIQRVRGPRRSVAGSAGLALLAMALGCRASHKHADPAETDPSDGGSTGSAVDAAPPPDEAIPQGPVEEIAARAGHLLEAIGRGDAQLATDILFPRDGWLATRDAPDPGKEWSRRVETPFRRTIRALSRRHADFDRAQVVSFELGRSMVQQSPRRHGWRKPLWTVHESRITFVIDGRTRTLPIREMTAWRGAWYVTRLR
jgi:hypothetical protein